MYVWHRGAMSSNIEKLKKVRAAAMTFKLNSKNNTTNAADAFAFWAWSVKE